MPTLLAAWLIGSFGASRAAISAQLSTDEPSGKVAAQGQRDGLAQFDVFVAGEDGYKSFRIPSLLVTPHGTVLAFCEGRKQSSGDSGDIDLVQRRSNDGGITWGPLQVIADDGPNTLGNPCPVVDRATGTIWMLMTRNHGQDKEPQILDGTSRETRSVWVMKSTHEGLTWSPRVEITKQVKLPDWTWYATGPGVSIQLESGRMVVPCDHFLAKSKISRSHVIYSDDHGATWKLGGVAGERINECQVVELSNRTLLLNMRNHPPKQGQGRAIATSRDGGLTWTPPTIDPILVEPACQASLIALKDEQGRASNRLLFSNPASAKRELMTVRLSEDGGRTWPRHKTLHAGPSAYSCLASLAGRSVGCLYERGERGPYERITLARFDLEGLASDTD
ncbi:sialidase-1 [Singulisphaera sp. GP187]|nr:sialidase-1 [Singulisphaera sp. GP187]